MVPKLAWVYTRCQTLLPFSQKDRHWLKGGEWAQLIYLLFSGKTTHGAIHKELQPQKRNEADSNWRCSCALNSCVYNSYAHSSCAYDCITLIATTDVAAALTLLAFIFSTVVAISVNVRRWCMH